MLRVNVLAAEQLKVFGVAICERARELWWTRQVLEFRKTDVVILIAFKQIDEVLCIGQLLFYK